MFQPTELKNTRNVWYKKHTSLIRQKCKLRQSRLYKIGQRETLKAAGEETVRLRNE